MATTAPANITTIARFPEHYFLENLAVRADGSILVTVLNHKQIADRNGDVVERAERVTAFVLESRDEGRAWTVPPASLPRRLPTDESIPRCR